MSIWINYWDSDEETDFTGKRKPKLKPKPKLNRGEDGAETDWATIATGVTVGVVAGAAIVYGVKQLFGKGCDSDEEGTGNYGDGNIVNERVSVTVPGPKREHEHTPAQPQPQASASTSSSPSRAIPPPPPPSSVITTPSALHSVQQTIKHTPSTKVLPQAPPVPVQQNSRPAASVIFTRTPTPRSSIRRAPPAAGSSPAPQKPKPGHLPPPPPPLPSSSSSLGTRAIQVNSNPSAPVQPNSSMSTPKPVPVAVSQTPLAPKPTPKPLPTPTNTKGQIVMAVAATPTRGGGVLVLHDAAEVYHYSLDWQKYLRFPGGEANPDRYETTNTYIALELFSPMIELIQEQNATVEVILKVDNTRFQRRQHLPESLGEEAEFWEFVRDIKNELTDSEWVYLSKDRDFDLARAHLLSQSTDNDVTLLDSQYWNYKHTNCSDAALRALKKHLDAIPSDYVLQN